MTAVDLDTLAHELRARLQPFQRRGPGGISQREILMMLTAGQPIPLGRIAAVAGISTSRLGRALRLFGAEIDDEGRLVGLGLTLRETPHRFSVAGRDLYTWCALDALLFPLVLGNARVESPCRATGTPIRIEVSPDGVESVEPPEAVVSFWWTQPGGSAENVRTSFCHHVHFFRSADAAGEWLTEHPGAVALPVAAAFELGLRLAPLLEESAPIRT